MAVSDGFKVRIESVALTRTQFVDLLGVWAKIHENCVAVSYVFADGHAGEMTYEEYKQLPSAWRMRILRAPSS